MLFPFYNNESTAYTIDDADYWCERVIVGTCDWSHRYATLCELVQNCPSVRQLTKPCIIDFLNNANSKEFTKWLDPDKWFLKVWTDWCLEIADPCICNDWDKYVTATKWDNNPWPLDAKVQGSCSYDWLYCIDIEEWWPQTLVWRPSGPNWPFINPDLPDWTCTEPYVKLKKSWGKWNVTYECPDVDTKPQYAKCIYSAWRASTSCKGRTVRYFVTRADSTMKPIDTWSIDNSNSYIDWDWSVVWTPEAFGKPSTYWVININMPWVYEIAFSTYITCWQTLHSIRCWLYADSWDWPKEINDIKYQCWEYPAPWAPWFDPIIFNRMFPQEWDPEVYTVWYTRIWNTLENTWLPFARTYVLNITRPTEIFMAVKPDMRDKDPRVVEANDDDNRYYLQVEWANWNAYWAATTIEIARVNEAVATSRLVTI